MAISNNNFGKDVKLDKLNLIDPRQDERIFATREGNAQMYIGGQTLAITNNSNGVVINESGTVIDGKVHIGRTPGDIRIAAFWILNDAVLTTLPSTTYTPIPMLKYNDPPYAKWLQNFARFVSGLG